MIKACNHFGWEYNSPVVKTYIRRRNSTEEDEIDKKVTGTTLESMDEKLKELELSKDLEIEKINEEMNTFRELYHDIEKVLDEKEPKWRREGKVKVIERHKVFATTN